MFGCSNQKSRIAFYYVPRFQYMRRLIEVIRKGKTALGWDLGRWSRLALLPSQVSVCGMNGKDSRWFTICLHELQKAHVSRSRLSVLPRSSVLSRRASRPQSEGVVLLMAIADHPAFIHCCVRRCILTAASESLLSRKDLVNSFVILTSSGPRLYHLRPHWQNSTFRQHSYMWYRSNVSDVEGLHREN